MQQLLDHDMLFIRRRMPESVVKLMKGHPDKAVIAGGFIRSVVANEPVNDIDIFAPDKTSAECWAQELKGRTNGSRVIATQNAYTLIGINPTVQVIHRWTYDAPEKIVDSFDYTIACSSVWWTRQPTADQPNKCMWTSLIHDRFYPDLASKRLVYLSPQRNEDAGGSILRMLKFYQRGYRMPLDSMGAVIARLLVGVKADNPQFWATNANEGYRAKILTGLLREVDPNFDPDHIAHLPASTHDSADAQEGAE